MPKRNWTKNQKNTSIPASDSNNPIKKESSLKEVVPVVQPMSASDSDESDKEELPIAQSKSNSETNKVAKSQQQSKAAGPSNSALASDESVVEKPAASKLKKKPLPKSQLKKTTKPVRNTPSSASDSDETDTERKQPTKKSKNQAYSASDSDETDRESKQPAAKNDKQSSSGESSSDESSSNETDPSSNNKSKSFRDLAKKKDHLVANRISFRRKLDYDPDRPAASKFKNRLVDDFVPKVNNEEFISDSDSETDSGEDYDSREYPSWQRGLGGNRHANTDPWPKPRKFGYSDKLNLEKRIKKICKVSIKLR